MPPLCGTTRARTSTRRGTLVALFKTAYPVFKMLSCSPQVEALIKEADASMDATPEEDRPPAAMRIPLVRENALNSTPGLLSQVQLLC